MQLFQKKSISSIKRAAHHSPLKQSFGILGLISLGLGGIIGTGIFSLTGLAAAKYAGPGITLSFLLGGLACTLTALVYSELAAMLPVAGGAFTYAYVALGEFAAAIVGWCVLMLYTFGSATVASSWSCYTIGLLKEFKVNLPPTLVNIPQEGGWINLPAIFVTLVITLLLLQGIKGIARLNYILVIIKLIAIFTFTITAMIHFDSKNWENFAPQGFSGIVAGAGFVFMAYTGFDALANAAEECRNPNRDLPIGIIGSILICTFLYMIVSGALTGSTHYSHLNNAEPLIHAFRTYKIQSKQQCLFQLLVNLIIAIGAIAGMTTVLLTQIYAQSRLLYVMARDHLYPSLFAKIHPKTATPHFGILISGLTIMGISGFLPVASLGQIGSMSALAAFSIISFCAIIMRHRYPTEKRPFRCPKLHLVACLSILLCGFLFIQLFLRNWISYCIAFGVGILIYGIYKVCHSYNKTI